MPITERPKTIATLSSGWQILRLILFPTCDQFSVQRLTTTCRRGAQKKRRANCPPLHFSEIEITRSIVSTDHVSANIPLIGRARCFSECHIVFVTNEPKFRNSATFYDGQCFVDCVVNRAWIRLKLKLWFRRHRFCH